jgi:Leucine Rich repeat
MAADDDWRAELERVLARDADDLVLNTVVSLGDAEVVEIAQRLSASSVKTLCLSLHQIGDRGAAALAELLRSGACALEWLALDFNQIGSDGVIALADALRENVTVKELYLAGNIGVDARATGSSETEAAAGIASLVAAIGVNTVLEKVDVAGDFVPATPHQKTLDVALGHLLQRQLGRERFLSGPVTKAARKKD